MSLEPLFQGTLMELNLNEYITFKPTPLGWEILKSAEAEIAAMPKRPDHMANKTPYYYTEIENKEIKMLFWKALDVFGKRISLSTGSFAENNTIRKMA